MPEKKVRAAHKSTNVRKKLAVGSIRLGLKGLSAVSTNLAARAAGRLFTRPRRFQRPEREFGYLRDAERFFFDLDGRRLSAWAWGEGPLVAMVHGWQGRGAQLGAMAAPLVAAGFRVVTFDGPAHGDSDGETANPVVFAEALLALAPVVGSFTAVVAHSMGAVATALALHRGLNVDRLVFVSPGAAPHRMPYDFGRFIGVSPDVVDRMKERLTASSGFLWADLEPAHLFGTLEVPLLVIHDREDTDVPLADAFDLVERWRPATLLVTEGLGHTRILRDPSVVQTTVDFLTAGSSDGLLAA